MSQVVFLVESVDRYGNPYTLTDRLKALYPEYVDIYNAEHISLYKSVVGRKIEFQSYDSVENFDPNKKYFYFICLDHWDYSFSVFFRMMGKSKLRRLVQNNIPIFFAYDLECIPHFEFDTFVKHLEWQFLVRASISNNDKNLSVQNKMIFCALGDLVPRQKQFIDSYFYNSFKFIHSPLVLKYSADQLINIYPSKEQALALNSEPKDRQFTCLNRQNRFHRKTLLHGLRVRDLLQEGYISNSDSSGFGVHESIIGSNTAYAAEVMRDTANPIPVMTLDSYDTPDRPYAASIMSFPPQLLNSYYDIASETGVTYHKVDTVDTAIVTEKTVKSIMLMRPFMINGGPHSLSMLRRFGFKTYDHIFDESYDSVENLIDRQEIIVNNVARYVGHYEELGQKIDEARDVMSHNRDHLLNADYEQLLINELMSVS